MKIVTRIQVVLNTHEGQNYDYANLSIYISVHLIYTKTKLEAKLVSLIKCLWNGNEDFDTAKVLTIF